MVLVSLGVFCGVCSDHRTGILDNFSIFQHDLSFHTRFYLSRIFDFCFLLADPFFCKREKKVKGAALPIVACSSSNITGYMCRLDLKQRFVAFLSLL